MKRSCYRVTRGTRRPAGVAWMLVLVAACATPAAARQLADEKPVDTTNFSIPETLLVRALYERATGHIEARRFSEAIADLQTIIEKHEGELLPGEYPPSPSGNASEGRVHAGASTRARAALLALPLDAKEQYRKRYEVEAAAALGVARAAHDAEALVEVGRRWPLANSAVGAFLSLGDLELERGHEREAGYAWIRSAGLMLSDAGLSAADVEDWAALSQRVAARANDPFTAPLLARIAVIAARSEARRRAEGAQDMERSLRLPNQDTIQGPLPGDRADAWAEPYKIPSHPYRETANESRDALFAVRSGERLFVSNSLRLVCLHAYTGEVLWDSNEPRGWSELSRSDRNELFKGVDRSAGVVAPAVSDSVVVCALQLPFALTRSDSYGNITILTPIPERRLFAFDVLTGRRLWDHTPPPSWDGEGGTFAQRTSAAAPPVIAGSRVLVPCVRMQGRINYNVGCFDLFTGELLWSRDVISGQREQNMFGRSQHEFCAAPLRVEGDKVIALTQLGTIAVLDLFTGEILWETLHETIDIPRSKGFDAPRYDNQWRNCPPIVQSGVILAAPFCSRDLLGLDLATGVTLWSHDVGTIRSLVGNSRVDVLFGATRDAIYVGGERWVALSMPSGMSQRGALRSKAQARDDEVLSRGGRPVLADDRVVDPRLTERIEYERVSGTKMGSVRWPEGSAGGNVLLGTGEMFVVSNTDVRGFFEWDVLVGRARSDAAKAPRDPVKVLRLARLLDGRGSSEWQRGETEAARAHFSEARTILERVLDAQASQNGGGDAGVELAAVYHSILRQGARVRAGLADSNGALADLLLARAWAPDASSLRDTLMEELAIRFEREGTPGADPSAVNAALDELERSCADLPLVVGFRIPNDAASTPFGIEFYPQSSARPDDSSALPEMPVGLWVLIQRDGRSARRNDDAGEFAALHAILERYPKVEVLTWQAGELARQRIEALLAAGRRQGYDVFEARAQSLYEEGVRTHDDGVLNLVSERFPGSRAALAANDARLDLALQGGDIGTVARIVRDELKDGFDLSTADSQAVSRLLRLADAFGRIGNGEARSALLRGLAAAAGETHSDVAADAGATIAELAAAAPQYARSARTLDRGRFKSGTDTVTERVFQGEFDLVGETLPSTPLPETPAGRPSTLIFARNFGRSTTALVAVDSDDPTAERWSVDIVPRTMTRTGPLSRRSGFAAGRALVATNEKVLAIDTDAGVEVWDWTPPVQAESISLAVRSGIAVAVVTQRGERDSWFVFGLDAKTGAELWRESGFDASVQRSPILSDTRIVFMPMSGNRVVVVLDLFTGTRTRRLDLEAPVRANVDTDAWIEGDRLIIPWFLQQSLPERSQVLALDLATGRPAWRVAIGDPRAPRWIAGVLQQGERSWLLLQSRGTTETMLQEQSLALLDTKIGALTPLTSVRIGMDDLILGLGRAERVVFPDGPIALLSPRSGGGRGPVGDARVRCIDLDRGELWVQGLGIPFDDLAVGSLPMPAASDTILCVVTVSNPAMVQNSFPRADLRAFDIATGGPRGIRGVHMSETRDVPQLVPLGELLIVRTKARMEFLK
jgi:outer membrane protein assembly factor BamB